MSKTRYRVVDRLELFEFHDAVFRLDHMDGEEIAVYAHGLNISKNAAQDPKGYDLQIQRAHISFQGVSDCTYTPGRMWSMDEHGNSVPERPEVIYRGAEALEKIEEELRAGIDVFSHSLIDGSFYRIDGMGIEPYFVIAFKARETVVEWDEYQGPAWYVSRQYRTQKLVLNTPDGETTTQAELWIDYDPEELFCREDAGEVDPKEVSVGIQYQGRTFWGRGTDRYGQDALANLQKQLPDGVILHGSLPCLRFADALKGFSLPEE